MFGFVSVPTSQPLTPIISHLVPDGYVDLVKKLGVENILPEHHNRTAAIAFCTTLSTMGLRQYDKAAVKKYLNSQYGRTPWGWRALRDKDNPKMGGTRSIGHWAAQDRTIDNGHTKWHGKNNGQLIGSSDTALYSKAVPMPVLRTVDAISSQFPEATFWISDEAVVIPIPKDPFLMVRYCGKEYIVERWDEPGFVG